MDINNKELLIREDLKLIAQIIEPNTRVIDIGCGDGDLLYWLMVNKKVEVRGLEVSVEGVRACVAKGLPVIHGDAEVDIVNYPDNFFDYAVLSLTLQAMRKPKVFLEELLRIGKKAIISIPNFGHFSSRLYLLLKGKMPVTESLPYDWFNTPNIHFCTIKDFLCLCEEMNLVIEKAVCLKKNGDILNFNHKGAIANILAEKAVFLVKKL